jgi:hypothetical protein
MIYLGYMNWAREWLEQMEGIIHVCARSTPQVDGFTRNHLDCYSTEVWKGLSRPEAVRFKGHGRIEIAEH